jgi:hypothetical protein
VVSSGEIEQHIGVYELIAQLKEEILKPRDENVAALFELERAEVAIEFTVSKDAKGRISFSVLSLGGSKRQERSHRVTISLIPVPEQHPTLHSDGDTERPRMSGGKYFR